MVFSSVRKELFFKSTETPPKQEQPGIQMRIKRNNIQFQRNGHLPKLDRAEVMGVSEQRNDMRCSE